jgi:hypothetical protein
MTETANWVRRPIFLQTGFRSGGTWLWNRFRVHPQTTAFIEPLNELLATLSVELIDKLTTEELQLNHPKLNSPYFEEYRKFIKKGNSGVSGYQVRMGLETYFRDDDEGNPGLREYLAQFISSAESCNTVPVLKFTRALGRAGWLKRHFPTSIQILLLRNPLLQFVSCYSRAVERGNYTFLMMPLFALSRASQIPEFREVIAPLGIPYVSMTDDVGACFDFYTKLSKDWDVGKSLQGFLLFHMLSFERSIKEAHIAVDLQGLVENLDYRDAIQHEIGAVTGIPVVLSDATLPDPVSSNALSNDDLRDTLLKSTESLLRDVPNHMKASRDHVANALSPIVDRFAAGPSIGK